MIEGVFIILLWLFFEIFIMPHGKGRSRHGRSNKQRGMKETGLLVIMDDMEKRAHETRINELKQQLDDLKFTEQMPQESYEEARYF